MKRPVMIYVAAGWLAVLLTISAAVAHITPSVVLVSDRDAVVQFLAGAQKFFVREVRLSPAERQVIRSRWGWSPDETLYRFYLGRDAQGRLVATALFLTEFTIHGPVRVAVGLGPNGEITGASVVELTEETYPWLKPLMDQRFTRDYVGQTAQASFVLSERLVQTGLDSMPRFYGEIVISLMQRAAILYEVTFLRRQG